MKIMKIFKSKISKYFSDVLVLSAYMFILTGAFLVMYSIFHGVEPIFAKKLLIKSVPFIFICANILLFALPVLDFLIVLLIKAYFKYSSLLKKCI